MTTPHHSPHPDRSPVLAFFDLSGADLALAKSGFTQEEFVSRLINLARDPDPTVSAAALKHINRYLREVAELDGAIASMKLLKESRNAANESTREVATLTTLRRGALPPRASGAPSSQFLPPAPIVGEDRAAPPADPPAVDPG